MAAELSAVDVAGTYLDALVTQDADRALLAPDVRRLHNGQVIVEGADAIRDILRREPLAGAGDRRWVVDGDHVIVFYDVDADPARATGPAGAPDTWIPTVRVALRRSGMFVVDATRVVPPPFVPVRTATKLCEATPFSMRYACSASGTDDAS